MIVWNVNCIVSCFKGYEIVVLVESMLKCEVKIIDLW